MKKILVETIPKEAIKIKSLIMESTLNQSEARSKEQGAKSPINLPELSNNEKNPFFDYDSPNLNVQPRIQFPNPREDREGTTEDIEEANVFDPHSGWDRNFDSRAKNNQFEALNGGDGLGDDAVRS